MAKKEHQFNVLMTAEDYLKLNQLADINDLPAAEIIRQSIRWRHLQQTKNVPLCTTGQRCLVPQMHVPPTAPNPPKPTSPDPGD